MSQTTETAQYYHVHEVLDLLHQQTTALTGQEIQDLIKKQFGNNCYFESCSMSGMTPPQVLEFLLSRQKIAETEPGKYVLNIHGAGCGH